MSIHKLVPLDNAIRHTIQLFGVENDVNEDYWIDYIAGALQDIRSYNQLVTKESIVTIIDHRGELPCDFYKLHEISIYNPNHLNEDDGYTSALMADLYVYTKRIEELKSLILLSTDPVQIQKYSRELADLEISIIDTEAIPAKALGYRRNQAEGIMFSNSHLVGSFSSNSNGVTDYRIENNTVFTGFKDGGVRVIYLAIPTDDRGLPLIPENQSFMNAIAWYIGHKLAIRGILKSRELTVQYCDRMWQRYCNQARADGNAPTLPEWQEISVNHNKMISNTDLYFQRFRDSGKRNSLTKY